METEHDRVLNFAPRATCNRQNMFMEERERKKKSHKMYKNIMVEASLIQSSKIINTYHVISEVSHIYRRDR